MIFHQTTPRTVLEIWFPKYSTAYTDTQERVALLAQYKVEQASPHIIVEFTKAKHLQGQRYYISREKAMTYPLDTNGKINCYAIPMSAFEQWETSGEVLEKAMDNFPE